MATIIEELTLPFISSYVPIQDKPKKLIRSDKQIICLSFEAFKFLEAKVKTEIPSINMAALRAKTRLAMEGSMPKSMTNESDLKNNSENK